MRPVALPKEAFRSPFGPRMPRISGSGSPEVTPGCETFEFDPDKARGTSFGAGGHLLRAIQQHSGMHANGCFHDRAGDGGQTVVYGFLCY